MQPFKRAAALLTTLAVVVLAGTGCNHNAATTGSAGGPALNGTDAVAKVNGDPITQAQFYQQLQSYVASPQMQSQGGEPAGHAVLGQMIQSRLICGLAKQENLLPTPAELETQYQNVKWLQEGHNVKPFEQTLEDMGMTTDSFKESVLTPQLCQFKLISKGVTVTDAEIKAYYDLNKAKQFTRPARAHVKRIVVTTKADADDIYKQIKGGKQFEDLVSRSVVAQPADGDLVQWLSLDDSGGAMLAPLVKAISKAAPGDTVAPIPFQGAFWIVKIVENKPKEEATLDTVKNLISTILITQKAQQNMAAVSAMQSKLRDYQMQATYDIPEKQYQDIGVQLKKPPPPAPAFPASAPPQMKPGGPPSAGGKTPTIKISPAPSSKP